MSCANCLVPLWCCNDRGVSQAEVFDAMHLLHLSQIRCAVGLLHSKDGAGSSGSEYDDGIPVERQGYRVLSLQQVRLFDPL